MATYINTSGFELDFSPNNGEKFTLEELQKLVDGYIERIAMPDGQAMYVNEEGKIKDLPYNIKATTILKMHGLIPNDYVVGDVVVLSNDEED